MSKKFSSTLLKHFPSTSFPYRRKTNLSRFVGSNKTIIITITPTTTVLEKVDRSFRPAGWRHNFLYLTPIIPLWHCSSSVWNREHVTTKMTLCYTAKSMRPRENFPKAPSMSNVPYSVYYLSIINLHHGGTEKAKIIREMCLRVRALLLP